MTAHPATMSARGSGAPAWPCPAGCAPVAVVMIVLNEAHYLDDALAQLRGWASEVFVVDSLSADDSVGIALRHGAHVVQRRFRGFGEQWNFALRTLPITAPWTMKLDPDERLTPALKAEILERLAAAPAPGDAVTQSWRVPIRLCFLGRPLPRVLRLTRLWRTGAAAFSDVAANEHARVAGREGDLRGEILHLDSPSLEHWFAKQNRYSTAEALARLRGDALADAPRLSGTPLQRRMWLKRHFFRIPGRYLLLFLHHLLVQGGWRAGRVGWTWSRLRTEVFRMQDAKYLEMRLRGEPPVLPLQPGVPDARVPLYDERGALPGDSG
jgi:glycosyltransferase involved in cell wall biosynthesis